MNGTSGMRPKIAQATFGPVRIWDRVARSIHMSTTAIGCRKHTSSSNSFFIRPDLPVLGGCYPTACPRNGAEGKTGCLPRNRAEGKTRCLPSERGRGQDELERLLAEPGVSGQPSGVAAAERG